MQGVFRDTYAFRTHQINTNHHLNGDDHLLYNISKAERVGNRRMVKVSWSQFEIMGFKCLCKPPDVHTD